MRKLAGAAVLVLVVGTASNAGAQQSPGLSNVFSGGAIRNVAATPVSMGSAIRSPTASAISSPRLLPSFNVQNLFRNFSFSPFSMARLPILSFPASSRANIPMSTNDLPRMQVITSGIGFPASSLANIPSSTSSLPTMRVSTSSGALLGR